MAENTYKPFAFRDNYTPEEGVTVYYNEEKTLTKLKNDCWVVGEGSPVTLIAPASRFVSTISTADANEQAQAWLEANAQAYANNTGVCGIPFISLWNTNNNSSAGSSANNMIKLPLVASGEYNMVVDWGDGFVSFVTDWTQSTHIYASAGIYTITISGICKGWQFNNTGDKLKILNITKFGPLQLGNSGGYFYGCSNLTLATVTDTLNLTGTTSLASAFRGCTSLAKAYNMNIWDVSNVTDMSDMFHSAESFIEDIGDYWQTGEVVNMSGMFCGAKLFNKDIGYWNTQKVEDMSNMFNGAESFKGDIGRWHTDSVVTMEGMFNGAKVFNKDIGECIDGAWNLSNVQNMSEMFKNTMQFSKDLRKWNTSSVITMKGMFENAIGFNSEMPLDTSNVEDMSNMFKGAVIFSKHLRHWNTSKVENMSNMFNGATAFYKDIGSWDVSSVTNFNGFMSLFTASYSLDSIYNFYYGWVARGVKPNITIHFGGAQYYSEEAELGYDALKNDFNWNIQDGGKA